MRLQPALLVVFGLLAGYVLAGGNVARAEAGSWQCYVIDRLPDAKAAADWKGSKSLSDGLNAVAPGAASGTVMFMQYPVGGGAVSPMVCTKS